MTHAGGDDCKDCDEAQIVGRISRGPHLPIVKFGLDKLCSDCKELHGLYVDLPDVCVIEPSSNGSFQKPKI